MTHLAADVVAHNYYVPNTLWTMPTGGKLSHVYVEAQAEDLFAFDDVRTGVGVGLRYLLPIGPLRVDAAFNPDRRSGEAEWVVHFAIGMPF